METSQKRLDRIAVIPAHLYSLAMTYLQKILPLGMRDNFLNAVQVHNCGTMYPLENIVIKFFEQLRHGTPHDVGLTFSMDAHVVPCSIYPGDAVHLDQLD